MYSALGSLGSTSDSILSTDALAPNKEIIGVFGSVAPFFCVSNVPLIISFFSSSDKD